MVQIVTLMLHAIKKKSEISRKGAQSSDEVSASSLHRLLFSCHDGRWPFPCIQTDFTLSIFHQSFGASALTFQFALLITLSECSSSRRFPKEVGRNKEREGKQKPCLFLGTIQSGFLRDGWVFRANRFRLQLKAFLSTYLKNQRTCHFPKIVLKDIDMVFQFYILVAFSSYLFKTGSHCAGSPRLLWNLGSSCLGLLSTRIIDVCPHTLLTLFWVQVTERNGLLYHNAVCAFMSMNS